MDATKLKKALMRVAKELDDYGQFHEDSEPAEIAWLIRELVTQHYDLEKKCKRMTAGISKLMEIVND